MSASEEEPSAEEELSPEDDGEEELELGLDSDVGEGPPADPEDWTDEQWIEWLKKSDDGGEVGPDGESQWEPMTTMGKVIHSSGGQVMGQAMLGLANAIYGGKEHPTFIVAEGEPEPEDDNEFKVHVDTENPDNSAVIFKDEPKSGPDALGSSET